MDEGRDPRNANGAAANHLMILKEGIYLILSRWAVLLFALDNESGGRGSRQLADQLASDVYSWFTKQRKANEPLYIDDLENILDETMYAHLHIDMNDDGVEIEENVFETKGKGVYFPLLVVLYRFRSTPFMFSISPALLKIKQVAEKMMIMHEECMEGNYSSVEKLRRAAAEPCRTSSRQYIIRQDDDLYDDDDASSSGSGGDDNMMMVDSPVVPQKIDDVYGWTLVSSKRRSGRRNR
ncbi:unnamed protein product [Linum tenue]|uniref:Pre-rRNA-processing protein TSR2 homolog n=1 Tax=Linum tenue TaxID=586396 RepID=A0AAV0LMM5_9ROSI|nr:unnamed protein product [Linum tenue]